MPSCAALLQLRREPSIPDHCHISHPYSIAVRYSRRTRQDYNYCANSQLKFDVQKTR